MFVNILFIFSIFGIVPTYILIWLCIFIAPFLKDTDTDKLSGEADEDPSMGDGCYVM